MLSLKKVDLHRELFISPIDGLLNQNDFEALEIIRGKEYQCALPTCSQFIGKNTHE